MYRSSHNSRILLALAAILMLSLACDLPTGASTAGKATLSLAPSQTMTEEPSATPMDTETPEITPTFTPTATATETALPTATLTVVHTALPDAPGSTVSLINDADSSITGPQGQASGGDDFPNNRFERPFLADKMVYLPKTDLLTVRLSIVSPWVYATFTLASGTQPEATGSTMYGLELDTDQDGRGNYLVWGLAPASAEWTTAGVEIWMDTNRDVGGLTPYTADPGQGGDGYDQNIFMGGHGSDPDAAWIRRGTDPNQVELAVKYSAINSATKFYWNAVADSHIKHPAWFDLNDHFTFAEAGSPLKELTADYPLKNFFGFDNTCVYWYGSTPTDSKPWFCHPPMGALAGTVFVDKNKNGKKDEGEVAIPGATVLIRQGRCPAPIKFSDITDHAGGFYFSQLPPDTYCVSLLNAAALGTATTPHPATVFVNPGEVKRILFGFSQGS
jgi:hypothetical protein